MNNLIVILTVVFLTACGGGSGSEKPTPKPEPKPLPVPVEVTYIYNNTDYKALSGVSIDNRNIITKAVYDQANRDSSVDCPACFLITEAVILGDDKDCLDCLRLSVLLDFAERDNGIKVFIVIEDQLTFTFVEALISSRGHSNIVLVSSSESLLLAAEYSYDLAIIGESNNNNIDWHVTDNSNCSAKCIAPIDADTKGFEFAITN